MQATAALWGHRSSVEDNYVDFIMDTRAPAQGNTCAKICGVVSYERAPKRCLNGHRLGPHRVVVGWTPCTCATALRPSGATGHRTYLCIVCEAEIFVPPHTGPLFSGVRWPPRQTQEQPRPDSGGE